MNKIQRGGEAAPLNRPRFSGNILEKLAFQKLRAAGLCKNIFRLFLWKVNKIPRLIFFAELSSDRLLIGSSDSNYPGK